MSAYVVSHAHINAILNWCKARMIGFDRYCVEHLGTNNLTEVGRLLLKQNCLNIKYLYALATPAEKNAYKSYEFKRDELIIQQGTPEDALQLISCYVYQCSDRPQWGSSRNKVRRFLDDVRCHIAYLVPSVEDCRTWDYDSFKLKNA
ncbi:hypothetical protein [Synechococcus elongatus]|uniref:hypothetical protein n=1 Tax=Synechococcus elongatus TaxID=32046 RepID=UPI000F7D9EDF|nr:hypothetical protein [Synechococcus elongatus]